MATIPVIPMSVVPVAAERPSPMVVGMSMVMKMAMAVRINIHRRVPVRRRHDQRRTAENRRCRDHYHGCRRMENPRHRRDWKADVNVNSCLRSRSSSEKNCCEHCEFFQTRVRRGSVSRI